MDTIGIIGLGQVGSSVAQACLDAGKYTYCADIDRSSLAQFEDQENCYTTTDTGRLANECAAVIITVPTPVESDQVVDLSAIESVYSQLAKEYSCSSGETLFITESTVPPGTAVNLAAESFESRGHEIGENIYIGSAPERINPGSNEWGIKNIPRVVSAITSLGREKILELYTDILMSELHLVESTEVAEASKIIENSFRDINIAFVNEIARSLDELEIDAKAAIDAAGTKPFGFMQFSPGAGVGGDCIPTDPYFLIQKANESGFSHRLLRNAREINDDMPNYIVKKTIKSLTSAGMLPQDSNVLILGRAFKTGVSDDRNSPYHQISKELSNYGANIETFDPKMPGKSSVNSPYIEADCVILITPHSEFENLDLAEYSQNGVKVFVDGRNMLNPIDVETHGIEYVGVGR